MECDPHRASGDDRRPRAAPIECRSDDPLPGCSIIGSSCPWRGGGEDDDDDDGGQGQRRRQERREEELVDHKFFQPPVFTVKSHFREWSEEFVDFIGMKSDELADCLKTSMESKVPLTSLGRNPLECMRAKKLYRILKKVVEHPEGKILVQHSPDKNVWEACRTLHTRFDPQNDSSMTATFMRCVNSS